MDGRCQCGKITFKTSRASPVWIHICHCVECRRQSGSAYGISAVFPTFELPNSEYLACWTTIHEDGQSKHHYFCSCCGTRLFHTDGKKEAFVKAGCLEGLTKEMMKKAAHIFTSRAVVNVPADAEQYEENYPDGKVPWKVTW